MMSSDGSVYNSDDESDDEIDVRKESHKSGSISWKTYKSYFGAIQSKTYVFVVFVIFSMNQVLRSSTEYFLSEWYFLNEIA